MGEILRAAGPGGVQVQLPGPTPAGGTAQCAGNASQLGLVVAVLVAARIDRLAAADLVAQLVSAANKR